MINLSTNNEWEKSKISGFFSRDLINQKLGTVKLIKIDPHCHYPVHKHYNKTEYALVLTGTPEIEVGNAKCRCSEGDFVIFPASATHAISNNGDDFCELVIGSILVM